MVPIKVNTNGTLSSDVANVRFLNYNVHSARYLALTVAMLIAA
jgi:hypothetical protein